MTPAARLPASPEAESEAPPRSPGAWIGPALAAASALAAGLLFRGLAPARPGAPGAWNQPEGFLIGWIRDSPFDSLLEDPWLALAVLGLPVAALAAAACLATGSALLRCLAVGAFVLATLSIYYGIQASGVWRFFHWRWSGVMLLLAGITALSLTAPLLARSWLRLAWGPRLLLYLPLFAGLLFLERDVTGTDPSLPFALSPWPAAQVFGLELVALVLSGVWVGSACGLALRGGSGAGWLALPAWGAALLVPLLVVRLGSAAGLLPFRAGAGTLIAVALLAAVAFGLTTLPRGEPSAATKRGVIAAAILSVLPLLAGQVLTRLDYVITRNVRATRIIDGLGAYYARESVYPDSLEELVAGGDLEAVPRPRIGFAGRASPQFTYQAFGTSYLLEFAAPRWIQCAYNPPYEEDYEDEYADEYGDEEPGDADEYDEEEPGDAGGLDAGAWTCPSRPPELW